MHCFHCHLGFSTVFKNLIMEFMILSFSLFAFCQPPQSDVQDLSYKRQRRDSSWHSGRQMLLHELLLEVHIQSLTKTTSFCLQPHNPSHKLGSLTNVDYVIISVIPLLTFFPETLKQDMKVINLELFSNSLSGCCAIVLLHCDASEG